MAETSVQYMHMQCSIHAFKHRMGYVPSVLPMEVLCVHLVVRACVPERTCVVCTLQVSSQATVEEACRTMAGTKESGCLVMDGERLLGV